MRAAKAFGILRIENGAGVLNARAKEANMLKGIPGILSPELMKVLMEMGHGDEIVLADRNFPAASNAKRLIRLDGHGIPELLQAILRFFPIDTYVEEPVKLMAVAPGKGENPEIWKTYRRMLDSAQEGVGMGFLERMAFYDRARGAYAIVATSEPAPYANIILAKGEVVSDV